MARHTNTQSHASFGYLLNRDSVLDRGEKSSVGDYSFHQNHFNGTRLTFCPPLTLKEPQITPKLRDSPLCWTKLFPSCCFDQLRLMSHLILYEYCYSTPNGCRTIKTMKDSQTSNPLLCALHGVDIMKSVLGLSWALRCDMPFFSVLIALP